MLAELLSLPASPLSLGLILLLAAALLWGRKGRASLALLLGAIALLWVASMPLVAGWLRASLEGRYPPVPLHQVPTADAILVLGGAALAPDPPRLAVELHDASDRVLHALRLYRAGKAPLIVISGDAPGEPTKARETGEVAAPGRPAAAVLLGEWGVPAQALLAETASRSTRDNAVNVKRLADERGWGQLLLVTSALHMPRALAAFTQVGLRVVPAPTDFHSDQPHDLAWESLLPRSGALAATSQSIKEYLSLLYYRWRDWI